MLLRGEMYQPEWIAPMAANRHSKSLEHVKEQQDGQ
jgi:hypothetical protein